MLGDGREPRRVVALLRQKVEVVQLLGGGELFIQPDDDVARTSVSSESLGERARAGVGRYGRHQAKLPCCLGPINAASTDAVLSSEADAPTS